MLLLKILFRNAFRHKLRTILTILGMTIAILAFGMLRTVVDAWYAGVEASQANRLITRNAISLTFALPISYAEKIRQTEGVERLSWGNWFGAYYKDERNFFANMAVEPASHLDVADELVLDPDEKSEYLKDRRGAIAGRKLAERFGWKIGDLITLKGTIYPGDWDFVLKGIYRGRDETVDESVFLFHWDYLNEAMKKRDPAQADQTGFYIVEVERPEMAAAVSERIDALFKNSLAETLTETERAFQLSFVSMTEAIMTAIQLVSIVVIVIIMAVSANTMAMSVRERLAEYATMRTLGFGAGTILLLIFGESAVITFTGALAGIILTFPAADFFRSELGQYFPIFNVKEATIWLDLAAALVVALVSAIIPAIRAATSPINSALRRAV
jgi:putative ABC transport system permease protein